MKIYEEIKTLRGNKTKRIRSGVFYFSGWTFLILGIGLIVNEMWFGASLVLFAFPCLVLYPAIRFLLGGKDSLAAVAATVVVEEVLKNEIKNIGKEKKKRRRC